MFLVQTLFRNSNFHWTNTFIQEKSSYNNPMLRPLYISMIHQDANVTLKNRRKKQLFTTVTGATKIDCGH